MEHWSLKEQGALITAKLSLPACGLLMCPSLTYTVYYLGPFFKLFVSVISNSKILHFILYYFNFLYSMRSNKLFEHICITFLEVFVC